MTRAASAERRDPLPRQVDVAVVGAGIVGLATARALLETAPGLGVAVLEKEARVAAHQSSRNSGVIHTGVYYRPGSKKAAFAVEGAKRMLQFVDARGLPLRRVGKVIVAVAAREVPRLEELHERGERNGVPDLRWLDAAGLREVEPEAAGVAALHVPTAAVTDFGAVAEAYAGDLRAAGAHLGLGVEVRGLRAGGGTRSLVTSAGPIEARCVIAAPGLFADRVARSLGLTTTVAITPFRGEYRELREDRRHLVRGLIYPVPDPALPFLGVHLTPHADGRVTAGPSAVPALSREGYRWRDVSLRDTWEAATRRSTWRLALRHARAGVGEVYRSLAPRAFLRAAQRLVPALRPGDLKPHPAGVRAQAVAPDGSLVYDFAIEERDGVICVLNAPSPAATASLVIGEAIAARALAALAE